MKNRALLFACVGILVCNGLIAKEYHVAKSGSDTNPGTVEAPFLTISKAAMVLNAGDTVTVHSGTYREWVSPRNSGLNRTSRIVYRAARAKMFGSKGRKKLKVGCVNGILQFGRLWCLIVYSAILIRLQKSFGEIGSIRIL